MVRVWLRNWYKAWLAGYGRRSSSARRATSRPRVEALEGRFMPSAYLVTTTADSGPGSLRDAINQINADTNHALYASPSNPGVDEIDFNITAASDAAGGGTGFNAATGVATIQPGSDLPAIGSSVIINGYTQSGANPNTSATADNATLKIVLQGTPAGIDFSDSIQAAGAGLLIQASGCTVQGLDINSFSNDGIFLEANDSMVTGCFIGTDVTGIQALGNLGSGIFVYGGSGNTIGGTAPGQRNVISGNGLPTYVAGLGYNGSPADVFLYGPQNLVEGNLIGPGADGNTNLAQANWPGVVVGGDSDTIGGSSPGARNVISGHLNSTGIEVYYAYGSLQGEVIQGNSIGTHAAGNAARPHEDGVYLVGGLSGTLVEDNLISGNVGDGLICDSLALTGNGTVVSNNYIGTDATGMHALGNGINGLLTQVGNITIVGNLISANGNLANGDFASANGQAGIMIGEGEGGVLSNVSVQGNRIGTDAAGDPTLGNVGDGVLLYSSLYDVTGNLIGGATSGAGNIIAGNQGSGVDIVSSNTDDDTVQGNSIYANGGLGIDLGDDGVNTNAHNDAANHVGPNELMNSPLLTSASSSPSGTTVSGSLDTNTFGGAFAAGTQITLDFYANSPPASGAQAQGQTWLGSYTLIADGTANVNFTAAGLAAIPAGESYLTATATDSSGNTSEFTPTVIQVTNGPGATIQGDVFVLNQAASGALTLSGNAVLNVAGTLQVDSNSASAVRLSGNARVIAAQTSIVGGYQVSGQAAFSGQPLTHASDVADPLAALAVPTGGVTLGAVNLSSGTRTINPGVYSGITVSGNASLILNPGIYFVGSGGMTVSGNASVVGTAGAGGAGVLIYNSGVLSISGNANVNLATFSTGAYADVGIFQAQSDSGAVTISGNATLNLHGSFLYDANVQSVVTVSGNALVDASLVVNELTISGNGDDAT